MGTANFVQEVRKYNMFASQGRDNQFSKQSKFVQPLSTPPFYAIALMDPHSWWVTPFITLGGLAVELQTGRVISEDGTPISGLYAAGRAAAGVPTGGYVSGLS